ncbi:hypothetical protein NL676_025147 [Syzygium grande]|nr:hypothetical protein NL676_025147 [Syzygium grande]
MRCDGTLLSFFATRCRRTPNPNPNPHRRNTKPSTLAILDPRPRPIQQLPRASPRRAPLDRPGFETLIPASASPSPSPSRSVLPRLRRFCSI